MAKMNDSITIKQALIGFTCSLILMLLGNFILFSREDTKEYDKKLDEKANKTYVDQQDKALEKQLETQSAEAKRREDLIIKWMESIDGRLGQMQNRNFLSKK